MANSKKHKIVKIDDIIRDKSDFLTNPKIGMTEIRAKYAKRKLDIPLEDTLRFDAKRKNICICCHNEATKLVYLEIKGGGLELQRFCQEDFNRVVNLDKMVMRPSDNSHLVIIKPSEGQTPAVEDWRHYVKKGAHF